MVCPVGKSIQFIKGAINKYVSKRLEGVNVPTISINKVNLTNTVNSNTIGSNK